MLVLSRKRYEKVILSLDGLKIEVQVLEIRDDKVRLGFKAPEDVAINREEVYEMIQKSFDLNSDQPGPGNP